MSRSIRALLCPLVLVAGCAGELGSPPSAGDEARPLVARGITNGRHLSLESEPSATAAALLPSGAHYRVVIASPEQVALVVVAPDRRILGRMRISSTGSSLADLASTIVIDDFGGPSATVEAWSSSGAVRGEATVGAHAASWQVDLATDGELSGRRWSTRPPADAAELLELRRAHAIASDLASITAELVRQGHLDRRTRRELHELLTLSELALDLSLRAWQGRGRAQLPRLTPRG